MKPSAMEENEMKALQLAISVHKRADRYVPVRELASDDHRPDAVLAACCGGC